MTHHTDPHLTLVAGGTGTTGRRVTGRLAARGVPVRIGSRSGTPPFDWDDPSTWSPVLRGVDAAYVAYSPDLAFPGAAEIVRAFAAEAVDHGVRRLVLLSGRGEDGARRGEQAVEESGAEWTIVRCSWFDQNFSEGHLLGPVLSGEIVLPVSDVAEPFLDADDIADVAVAALTEPGHAGQLYELTGPRLLTFTDAAAEISAAAGRDVRFVAVSAEDYEAVLAELEGAEFAKAYTGLFTEVLDGRNSHLNDGVQRALGHEPTNFTDFVRRAAATGVWNGE
jgi:uncharacterized protein YbjT (DUF2867 family)